MPCPSAVFVVQLVQDIVILRPLVYMAARDFHFDVLLLASTRFRARDSQGIWESELAQICAETGARLQFFENDLQAHRQLDGHGLLFSASESHLPQHHTTHSLFLHAPATYLKVTVQHGFECIGFRHSKDHVRAHGSAASFAADIICSWAPIQHLKSIAPSQAPKLIVTGPTAVLQTPTGSVVRGDGAPGLVCENLHSVRFKGEREIASEFIDTFGQFSRAMAAAKRVVTLRTHPGGQYAVRTKLAVQPNVTIESAPLYRTDLRQFAYGISAPSSVLIDMLLAGIPTAVWHDHAGHMDASAYEGLEWVSSPREWTEFAIEAESNPDPLIERQRRFLDSTKMPLCPQEVFSRFGQLFQSIRRSEMRRPGSVPEHQRILFIANGNVPTLQLSFEKPLAPLVVRGAISAELLTEQQMRGVPGLLESPDIAADWLHRYLDRFGPSMILFCRYSGAAYQPVLDWARREQVPIIYHIDDDLLGVPRDIGERKFSVHNAPARLRAVRELLNAADLVYASTVTLRDRLLAYFPGLPIVAGKIYCSAAVLRTPSASDQCKVGYMASADHAHNLAMVLPAIERLLETRPRVHFELFGSIGVPAALERFGDRIVKSPPIAAYDQFLEKFAQRSWDIGICPLTPIEFNRMKANTKWVEYTSAGVAVVASRGTVYDQSCAGGCGVLANSDEEWFSALDLLVDNVEERIAIVERAQAKLRREFNVSLLRRQILEIFAQAHAAAAARLSPGPNQEDVRVCQIS